MSTSKQTAISAFDKLDQASLSYNQNHHADLSSILAQVPQHLSKLISHAEHLKEKCQNARTLFQNVIDVNLQVIAFRRIADENPPSNPPVMVDSYSVAPELVKDVTGKDDTGQLPRFVRDEVDNIAALVLDHHGILKVAHDAQDGIFLLHCWAHVFEFEEGLRQDGVLKYVRRVVPKSLDARARSYTKYGVPVLHVISGLAPVSDIEKQNRVLSERVVLADLFISFYSDVVQTLQFVHDNLDSFRTLHRKLSEEMKLVTPVGADRRDVLREAVIATSEAYDAVKGV